MDDWHIWEQRAVREAEATWPLNTELYGMILSLPVQCGMCPEDHPWVMIVSHN